MQLRNSEFRYGGIAQLFHWAIVVLIITQFVLAWRADSLPLGLAKLATLAQHKSFGMTILGLAILRLIWRWMNPVPAMPAGMPAWQRSVAHVSHYGLYILLFVIPVLGWLMSSAKNYKVSWFNLFSFPDLIAADEARFELLRDTHAALAYTLFALALVHIAGALKHHFIDRDDVLRRMLPVKLRGAGK